MPRKRKTMSGEDAQNIGSVPGQRYGEGDDQQAMQRAMPAPDMQQPVTAAPSAPPVFGNPGGASRVNPDPMQVQQFLSQTKPNLLGGTMNPDQPITAGLSTGPGPGPEVLARNTSPMRRYLERLSADTGNPKWKMLAEKAGL